MAPKNKNEGTT